MNTIRLALFGQPVSHSPSPRVHRAFAVQFGLDLEYRLIEASPEAFPERLEAFRSEGGAGCNITLPLKHIACELADERSRRAELANAANTLSWTLEGRCRADNTDGEGLVRDLEDHLGVTIAGRRVLVLGAGGAAAGVLGALLARRPEQLAIVNRTLSRARALAARHSRLGDVLCLSMDDFERSDAPDLLIDATSMGHFGRQAEIPRHVLEGSPLCYSLNYGTAAQPLASLCRLAGLRFHDGLGMLVEQAACSFEIWTGRKPDTAPVREELAKSSV